MTICADNDMKNTPGPDVLVRDTAGHKTFGNVVWAWCHASNGSDMCLRWTPEQIACAFMYGAGQDLDVEVCLAVATSSSLKLDTFQIKHAPDQPWWKVCLPQQPIDEAMILGSFSLKSFELRHHCLWQISCAAFEHIACASENRTTPASTSRPTQTSTALRAPARHRHKLNQMRAMLTRMHRHSLQAPLTRQLSSKGLLQLTAPPCLIAVRRPARGGGATTKMWMSKKKWRRNGGTRVHRSVHRRGSFLSVNCTIKHDDGHCLCLRRALLTVQKV